MQLNNKMEISKGTVILGVLCLSLAIFIQVAAAEKTDTIIANFKGEVEVRQGQTVSWQTAEKGRVIQPGDVVRTGAQSWATIRHNSAKIQLFENTLIEFPREQSSQQVHEAGNGLVTVVLQKGHSLFKVFKNRLKRRFEVISPSLIAGVKGTVFEVFEKESFKGVAVSEGVVEVVNLDFRDEIMEVTANQYTEIRDLHLMPPQDHRGEDLLREEKRSQAKPGDGHPENTEAIETETAVDPPDENDPVSSDLETASKEGLADLDNVGATLAQDLRDEKKALNLDLRDERKELKTAEPEARQALAEEIRENKKEAKADLREERKAMLAELRDERKALAIELRDERKELAVEIREDTQAVAAEVREDAQTVAAEVREDAQTVAAEVREDAQTAASDTSSAIADIKDRIQDDLNDPLEDDQGQDKQN